MTRPEHDPSDTAPKTFGALLTELRLARGWSQLRVAEQYITNFGELAKTGNTLILPANLSDVGSMISLAMNVIRRGGPEPKAGNGQSAS